MEFTYSPEVDALAIELAPDAQSARTMQHGDDVLFDFDADDRLIGIEVLNASEHYDRAALEQLASPVDLLTLAEAAKESGLSAATLRVQLNRGRLRGEKRGRDWLVPRHELWNYLESREPTGRPPTRRKGRTVRKATAKR